MGVVFLEQEGVVGVEGVPGTKVGGSPVPGGGVVEPVPVRGGGDRVGEAGEGVYSDRSATDETRDPSKCSCQQTPGKDDNGAKTQFTKDNDDHATYNSTLIII